MSALFTGKSAPTHWLSTIVWIAGFLLFACSKRVCSKNSDCKGDDVCRAWQCEPAPGNAAAEPNPERDVSAPDAGSSGERTGTDENGEPDPVEDESANADSTDDKDPTLQRCAGSDDCEDGAVCIFHTEEGYCSEPTKRGCEDAKASAFGHEATCVDGFGFDFHPSVDSRDDSSCETSADCDLRQLHLRGTCIDTAGNGKDRACVPLCEFSNDRKKLSCVTDPQLTLSGCSRDDKRLQTVIAIALACNDNSMSSWSCNTEGYDTDKETEWTVRCMLEPLDYGRLDCLEVFGSSEACFVDSNSHAKQTISTFMKVVNTAITTYGSSDDKACHSDWDCPVCHACVDDGHRCSNRGMGPFGCYGGRPY